jgi:hypothetical protein
MISPFRILKTNKGKKTKIISRKGAEAQRKRKK